MTTKGTAKAAPVKKKAVKKQAGSKGVQTGSKKAQAASKSVQAASKSVQAASKSVENKSATPKTAANSVKASKSTASKKPIVMSSDEKRMMIAVHAYYKWENAGFPEGEDYKHWVEAEDEIEALLN